MKERMEKGTACYAVHCGGRQQWAPEVQVQGGNARALVEGQPILVGG